MSREPLRIGSLFTGTGALDLAVMDVFDSELVWHSQYEPPDKNGREDTNQYAARILARHWPDVPNLGDITKVDWQAVLDEHGPIDILTGGFPCTDVSSAGKRAGLTPDTRSGLWTHMSYAISILQPRLVVIENVEGLLSAPADRGLGLDAEALEEEARAGRVLRALGAVLGDLASLGFDAEWARVAASEVGAPHQRKRVFVYAWPAAVDPGGLGRWDRSRILGRLGAEGRGTEAASDPADLGHERVGDARDGRTGPEDGRLAASDTQGEGLQGLRPEPARGGSERSGATPADTDGVEPERRGVAGVLRGQAAAEPGEGDQRERSGNALGGCSEAASDADGRGREGHQERDRRPEDGQPEREPVLDAVGRGVRGGSVEPVCPTCLCLRSDHDVDGLCAGCLHCVDPELGQPGRCPDDCPVCTDEAVSDAQGVGRREGRTEPAWEQGGPDVAERGSETPADADHSGRREDVLQLRPGQPDLDWGDYEPAIRRWEAVLGRPAPWPTDALGRLSPVFTEWLMGLPDGWVTDTPGLTRSAMLRALGNGVVWLQAAAAIRLLHSRAVAAVPLAA